MAYFKGSPDEYVVLFKAGEVKQHGRGLSFFYNQAVSTVMVLPATSCDAPFIFTEPTANFQDIALQGSLVYRVAEPLVTAEQYDFSLRGVKEGAEKLRLHLVNVVQGHARAIVSRLPLEQVLTQVGDVTASVAASVAADETVSRVGIVIESLHFSCARATPEVQKALQTEYREKLLKEADLAIYARRKAAMESEREINERELATEIEFANRRKELVDTDARNKLILAEAQSKAEDMKLAVYRELPPSTLAVMALKSWAESGGAVSNLTITPDIITSVLSQFASHKEGG